MVPNRARFAAHEASRTNRAPWYRILSMQEPQTPNLVVHLQGGDDEVAVGRISGYTPETIDVDIVIEGAPAYSMGTALSVSIDRGKQVNRFATQVVARKELDGSRRYTLRVAEPAVLAFLGARDLRGNPRVRPGSEEKVEVNLYLGGQAPLVRGSLYDLSSTGLAVWLPAEEDVRWNEASEVSVRFTIPGEKKPTLLVGAIRNRTLLNDGIKYGIAFDEAATKRFSEQWEDIKRYIRRRQLEELQAARELLDSQVESTTTSDSGEGEAAA